MTKEEMKSRGIGVGNKRGRKPKEKRLLLDMDRKKRRYHHRQSEDAMDEDDEDVDDIALQERMTMIAQQQLQGSHQLHRLNKKSSSRSESPRPNSPIECSTKVQCDDSDDEDAESPHGRSNWNRHDGRVDYPSSTEDLANNTSVKDIEDAMNKHLPLLQAKELSDGKQRPTIQWIGGTAAAQQGSTSSTLAASALLRQLYVNRESVIRSNVHSTRTPFFGASVDLQATLPTPPGGAVGPVDASTYTDPFVLSSKLPLGHPGDTPYAYPTAYAAEAYGAMTPPSSVSPRDKLHPAVVGGFPESGRWIDSAGGTGNVSGGNGGMETGTGSSGSHLPLKPQAYPAVPGLEPPPFPAHTQQGTLVHMSDHHHHHHHHHHPHALPHLPHPHHPSSVGGPSSSAAGQQFYPHHASSFHVYHPMASKMTPPPMSTSSLSSSSASPPVTSTSSSTSTSSPPSSSSNSYIESVKNGNVWYPPTNT